MAYIEMDFASGGSSSEIIDFFNLTNKTELKVNFGTKKIAYVVKCGKIVLMKLRIEDLNTTGWNSNCITMPAEFTPSENTTFIGANGSNGNAIITINSDGSFAISTSAGIALGTFLYALE